MRKPLSLADVELVCAVLARLDDEGRGAANAVAAERRLARSVVSDRLARVEQHFGHVFVAIERGRTGRLTEEGRLFLVRGREMLATYDRLRDELGGRVELQAEF